MTCFSFFVGGSVPVFDEVILSMSLMNQVLSFDDISGKWVVCSVLCQVKLISIVDIYGGLTLFLEEIMSFSSKTLLLAFGFYADLLWTALPS